MSELQSENNVQRLGVRGMDQGVLNSGNGKIWEIIKGLSDLFAHLTP